jgi:hypothetical protein
LRRKVVKSVELDLLPLTKLKREELSSLFSEYTSAANETLFTLRSERPSSETKLHHLTYTGIREKSRLPAQLVCAARLDAWARRRHTTTRFRHLPVSYNVSRSGSLRQTRRGNPILGVASLNGRLGLPVARDGAWRRFNKLLSDGWTFTEFRLLNMRMVRVTLKRMFQVASPAPGQAVLGVDVGVDTLAAVTVLALAVWRGSSTLGETCGRSSATSASGAPSSKRMLHEALGGRGASSTGLEATSGASIR